MKLKQISPEQFAMETGKFLEQAKRGPILVQSGQGPALLLHSVSEDDLVDEIVIQNPRFRASIRRARRNRAAGKGVPLSKVREML